MLGCRMTAPYWSNGVATLYQADARAIPLPDGSVHCCITSPPYWGLRDYGLSAWDGGDPECGHRKRRNDSAARVDGGIPSNNNHAQEGWAGGVCGHCGATQQAAGIGLEPTLSDWLANIVAVGREVWRVLRDDGTYWLNLGDAYSGSSKQTGRNDVARMYGEPSQVAAIQTGKGVSDSSLPAKNLMGQPWRAAFALQDDGWILRSAIVWHKPNPMPESVSDRPTSAYEMVFLLAKRAHYFYDAEAVREPQTADQLHRAQTGVITERSPDRKKGGSARSEDSFQSAIPNVSILPAGRNARNVWTIPTQGRPEAHFATFPDELPRRCILAGTSEHGVCADCGAPWARETDSETIDTRPKSAGRNIDRVGGMSRGENFNNGDIRRGVKHTQTVGWQPTCDCGPCEYHRLLSAYRRAMAALDDVWNDADPPDMPQPPTGECTHPPRIPATVLDPFVGSGTTVAVAQQLGRHGIGLDLNPDYLAIAAKRLAGITLPLGIGL